MLPAANRMRSAKEFEGTVRGGVRVGRPSLVVHARLSDAGKEAERVRVGLVVSGKLGNAVQRNRVKRRLRHLARAELAGSPAGLSVVVRVLPAARETPERLAGDFASAWRGSIRRLGAGPA